jgi:small subunit ribosomal protein S21
MTTIRVKDNEPFEVALRRFKRTSERKRKKAAAVKRNYKRIRSMQLPKKLY